VGPNPVSDSIAQETDKRRNTSDRILSSAGAEGLSMAGLDAMLLKFPDPLSFLPSHAQSMISLSSTLALTRKKCF
jgi:hypothetical protein